MRRVKQTREREADGHVQNLWEVPQRRRMLVQGWRQTTKDWKRKFHLKKATCKTCVLQHDSIIQLLGKYIENEQKEEKGCTLF